jgi:hypothetical protein
MANFKMRVTSGAEVADWTDYPTEDRPSRLNPVGSPHRYLKAVVNTPIEAMATPESTGVEGEIDANLSGFLFSWWFASAPVEPYTPISDPGFSSRCRFTPPAVGNYELVCYRPRGGSFITHICVEAS